MSLNEEDEDEYIAESRDPTPEPTYDGDLSAVTTPSRYANQQKQRAKDNERVPDMQLGKCRYVRLHDNINYVAAALVLRGEDDSFEILLIQEAKKKCHGKWYIPAGRVEAGETIEHAVHREMYEETGYRCDVVELLSLQVQGSGWYRYAFVVNVTGGEIKTKPDEESLCARWFPVNDVLSKKIDLRGNDFLKLVDEALVYRKSKHYQEVLPVTVQNVAVPGMFVEFMIYRNNIDDSKVEVLVHRSVADEEVLAKHDQPFPTCEFGFEYFFAMVVSKCYKHLLEEGANVVFSPSSVTRIRCLPSPIEAVSHGLAVRLACQHKKSASKAIVRSPSRYHWITVDNESTKRQLRIERDQYRPSLHML